MFIHLGLPTSCWYGCMLLTQLVQFVINRTSVGPYFRFRLDVGQEQRLHRFLLAVLNNLETHLCLQQIRDHVLLDDVAAVKTVDSSQDREHSFAELLLPCQLQAAYYAVLGPLPVLHHRRTSRLPQLATQQGSDLAIPNRRGTQIVQHLEHRLS